MLQPLPQAILDCIGRVRLSQRTAGAFCVAFSGGADSTALLHAMKQIAIEHPEFSLRAVHIDHQLQSASTAWSRRCEQVCSELAVPFVAERVVPDPQFPEGLEAAARAARYGAFKRLLQPGETLLTAHHADDQLETVLLALVRGAGLGGLSAMPEIRRFANGWHLRPLLDITRAAIQEWAQSQGLDWIDDPSNRSSRFDRNFLRSEVLPALQQRWPSLAHTVSRSARHIRQARHLLEELGDADLSRAAVGRCLDMRVVKELSPSRRANLIRRWLSTFGVRMPSTRKLAALENDILVAGDDKLPRAAWDDVEVRRHGELLYCERTHSIDTSLQLEWTRDLPLALPGALGTLEAVATEQGAVAKRLPAQLQVRFRRGGEKLQLPGRSHRSYLKNLLQDACVLPWWRDRLPLIYAGGQLIAVADLWVAADFASVDEPQAICFTWHRRPDIFVQART